MRLSGYFTLLALFAITLSCNPASKKEVAETVPGLNNGKQNKEKFGYCDSVSNSGVSVRVNLWMPSDSGEVTKEISAQLDKKVIERINSYADSASVASNPEARNSVKAAYEVFAKNYAAFKKEFPDAPGCWEVEVKGDTIMVTPKVFLYQIDHYSFTGGAHPNSFKSLHIFDGKTGAEMEMKTFVSDTAALLKKVEAAFRKTEKLTSDKDLEEEGYFLSNHRFFLPANYSFTRNGILFYYNPYEIAPYVKGVIQFTIPYAELNGMVKKELVF
ncbi:DUF3298 and DUF4163 domain-containing protein [Dyadobacter sp. NIV53]|uniref:DUF3298 and DUF4163 domain-containing protein n=1 Tax=Dyadobacter sp. NIV53 TaxID=2861765 RepID=UPI001C884A90|nr:DUF3298 and DUF4163 domain-containing protein [Dyadobacter sp. NIV53]